MPFCCWCDEPDATDLCSGCMLTHYCNRDCQKAHWKIHKTACKELKRDMREDVAEPWYKHVADWLKLRNTAAKRCAACDREDVEVFLCQPCRILAYCSVQCQRKDWTRGGHKAACPLIQRASFHLAMKNAMEGDPPSLFFVSVLYRSGRGVTMDEGEAFRWTKRAAEAGEDGAQFNLGFCYTNGTGVTADAVEAARWYKRAAEAGNADAEVNLGVCYENGTGVTADPV